ncbi:MAG TPA: hypothetical protein VGL60_06895 [Acidimicrobiales bacterium]|jgi:hypothetical protein
MKHLAGPSIICVQTKAIRRAIEELATDPATVWTRQGRRRRDRRGRGVGTLSLAKRNLHLIVRRQTKVSGEQIGLDDLGE